MRVSVKADDPARAVDGVMYEMSGAGLVMVHVAAADVPPHGVGFTTVTETVEADARSLAEIEAVSCVELK